MCRRLGGLGVQGSVSAIGRTRPSKPKGACYGLNVKPRASEGLHEGSGGLSK